MGSVIVCVDMVNYLEVALLLEESGRYHPYLQLFCWSAVTALAQEDSFLLSDSF